MFTRDEITKKYPILASKDLDLARLSIFKLMGKDGKDDLSMERARLVNYCNNQSGGVIATGPDMEGEMNCPCGGDDTKCTCYDKHDFCDCWGCGGWN